MPMTALEFLDLLVDRGVMPALQIDDLRAQVIANPEPVHPVYVARRLVQEGYLNPYHAKNLLTEGAEHNGQDSEHKSRAAQEPMPELEPLEEEGPPEHPATPPCDEFDLQLDPLRSSEWMVPLIDDERTLPPATRSGPVFGPRFTLGLPHVRRQVWLALGGALLAAALLSIALMW